MLVCWGDNSIGQLGDGTNTTRTTPISVKGLGPVKAVSLNGRHACAITGDDSLSCWGANGFGQLGDGTAEGRNTPQVVNALGQVKAVGLLGGEFFFSTG